MKQRKKVEDQSISIRIYEKNKIVIIVTCINNINTNKHLYMDDVDHPEYIKELEIISSH